MVEKGSKSSRDAIPEIDERSQISSVCTQQNNRSRFLPERIFLPYGVGPIIDCEIDDDCDEPDYLSYSIVPKMNMVEDSSIPGDGMPEKNC